MFYLNFYSINPNRKKQLEQNTDNFFAYKNKLGINNTLYINVYQTYQYNYKR